MVEGSIRSIHILYQSGKGDKKYFCPEFVRAVLAERPGKKRKNSLPLKKGFTEGLKCLIITCYVYGTNHRGNGEWPALIGNDVINLLK